MSVSVVIPSRGVAPDLRPAVEQVLRAAARTGADAEVLVVVNGRDCAPALDNVGSPHLRVLYLERANVARARNVGLAAARHDTVLFGDDGGSCAQTWCLDLANGLRDPRYPVVTAPVRVPVTGGVTAFLNHQRIFDAPPVDGIEAQTVTGNCGVRRDLLPADVRYDETNLPLVGEDVAFGHAVRAAGLRIRWLATVAPGWHLLSDRVEEITDRLLRYGRGVALVWCRGDTTVTSPREILALYRYLSSDAYTVYRRFGELHAPSARSAFAVYDYLYDLAFLVGYLAELGTELDHTFVALDADGLRAAWHDLAGRVAAQASHLDGGDWGGLRLAYDRLDSGVADRQPMITEVRQTLARYAPLVSEQTSLIAGSDLADQAGGPSGIGQREQLDRLREAWRALRGTGRTITADEVDHAGRSVGFGFREACAVIERTALRRTGGAGKALANAVTKGRQR